MGSIEVSKGDSSGSEIVIISGMVSESEEEDEEEEEREVTCEKGGEGTVDWAPVSARGVKESREGSVNEDDETKLMEEESEEAERVADESRE